MLQHVEHKNNKIGLRFVSKNLFHDGNDCVELSYGALSTESVCEVEGFARK